ncbi:MAG: DUF882 domain-containing protein [Rhizobiales bacterium]|nr:DUF882 domain-containing protein [Hyphomicrobiales bacterium]
MKRLRGLARGLARPVGVCALAVLTLAGLSRGTQDASANGETRTLDLYHAHTRESLRITFKRDGVFDSDALAKLNHFLRDWRNDDTTSMAPQLFDVVWYVYREVGATEPVKVVSAYRSPGTNAMLARRSRAVAKNSHHMRGNAMDFHIPGVSMAKVRELGMRLQRGGVGYYPTAGSPFVHLDVGTVRSWPRMPREQLERIFPDGKTVHIPSDGVPLANYQLALAEVQARGGSALDYETVRSSRGSTLWALLFGSGAEEDTGDEARPSRVAARRTGRNAPAVAQSSVPASSGDNVMVASVEPVARAAPVRVEARPIEAELRPQPGSEPAAPASSAVAPALQAAALPLPPIRPRDLGVAVAALPGTPVAAELPLPPVRPRGVAATPEAEAKTFEVAAVASTPLPANLPLPPRRPSQPATEAGAVALAAATPAPSGLPGIMTRPTEPEAPIAQSYAPANLPLPPSRVAALAPQPRAAARPIAPIRVKSAADAEGKADLTALIEAESARQTRPRAVVNVTPPPVEAEIRREVVALKLEKSAPVPEKNGFAGGFIRPISPRFTKAGE